MVAGLVAVEVALRQAIREVLAGSAVFPVHTPQEGVARRVPRSILAPQERLAVICAETEEVAEGQRVLRPMAVNTEVRVVRLEAEVEAEGPQPMGRLQIMRVVWAVEAKSESLVGR